MPTNYVHRSQQNIGESANNKFLTLWGDAYQGGPGWGGGWETWPDGAGSGQLKYHNFRPDQSHRADPAHASVRPFDLADRGTWVTFTAQVKLATAANNDGEMRVWRRRGGNGANELIYEMTSLPIYNGAGNYLERGYLLGWTNSGFAETTVFYLDNVAISTSPL